MDDSVLNRVASMRQRDSDRDGRMQDVYDIRNGDTNRVLPGMFPAIWPKPIVANFVDTTARDLAEVTGTTPSINCESALQVSDRARNFAAKRTKIAHYIFDNSNVGIQLISGADRYYTYGFVPFMVEADFEMACPLIILDNPMGVHYTLNLLGVTTHYVKVWREDAIGLAAKFPDHRSAILGDERKGEDKH